METKNLVKPFFSKKIWSYFSVFWSYAKFVYGFVRQSWKLFLRKAAIWYFSSIVSVLVDTKNFALLKKLSHCQNLMLVVDYWIHALIADIMCCDCVHRHCFLQPIFLLLYAAPHLIFSLTCWRVNEENRGSQKSKTSSSFPCKPSWSESFSKRNPKDNAFFLC